MNETKEPLRGEKLLKSAINQILKHPETWNQASWHSPCGTKHCIAGWCQILAGNQPSDNKAMEDAKTALGITDADASFLFRSNCTLTEAYYFAENFSLAGYNLAGYNRAGYDRAGYNLAGYNRAGYDRAGYNLAGYNLAGYDRAGYNLAGYDRAGYNRAGYDRAGYDRAGYNRAGYDRAGYDRAGKILTPFEI